MIFISILKAGVVIGIRAYLAASRLSDITKRHSSAGELVIFALAAAGGVLH